MFAAIARVFWTFRRYIAALRAGVLGLIVVSATWIFLLPATPDEINRLNLSETTGMPSANLRTYRIAKLTLLVGSDRVYELVAEQSDGKLTPNEVRFGVVLAAEGYPLREKTIVDPAEATPQRGTSAKFVSARQN